MAKVEQLRALRVGDAVLVRMKVGVDIIFDDMGTGCTDRIRHLDPAAVTIPGKPGGKKITVSASEIVGVVEVQIPDLEGGRHSFPRPCHPSRVEEVAQNVRVSLHAIAPGCVEMPEVMLNGQPEKFPGDRSGDSLVESVDHRGPFVPWGPAPGGKIWRHKAGKCGEFCCLPEKHPSHYEMVDDPNEIKSNVTSGDSKKLDVWPVIGRGRGVASPAAEGAEVLIPKPGDVPPGWSLKNATVVKKSDTIYRVECDYTKTGNPSDAEGPREVEAFRWEEHGSFDNVRDNVEELESRVAALEKGTLPSIRVAHITYLVPREHEGKPLCRECTWYHTTDEPHKTGIRWDAQPHQVEVPSKSSAELAVEIADAETAETAPLFGDPRYAALKKEYKTAKAREGRR